jgi:hypothetical protein
MGLNDLHPKKDDPEKNELDERDLQITRRIKEMPTWSPPEGSSLRLWNRFSPKDPPGGAQHICGHKLPKRSILPP